MTAIRWPYIPVTAPDAEVFAFLADAFTDFNPFSLLTADEVLDAAIAKFGSKRCDGIEFWLQ